MPAARTASATPATSGASGPTTTRSTPRLGGQRGHRGPVHRVDVVQGRDLADARVARRGVHLGVGIEGQGAGQRVLAAAGADDEGLHGRRSYRRTGPAHVTPPSRGRRTPARRPSSSVRGQHVLARGGRCFHAHSSRRSSHPQAKIGGIPGPGAGKRPLMSDEFTPTCRLPSGLVLPTAARPRRPRRPHPRPGPGWRGGCRSAAVHHRPADAPDVVEQRILDVAVRLGPAGAVTGWAALQAPGCGVLRRGRSQPAPSSASRSAPPTASSVPDPELRRDPRESRERAPRWSPASGSCHPSMALLDHARAEPDDRELVVALDMACAAGSPRLRRVTAASWPPGRELRGVRTPALGAAVGPRSEPVPGRAPAPPDLGARRRTAPPACCNRARSSTSTGRLLGRHRTAGPGRGCDRRVQRQHPSTGGSGPPGRRARRPPCGDTGSRRWPPWVPTCTTRDRRASSASTRAYARALRLRGPRSGPGRSTPPPGWTDEVGLDEALDHRDRLRARAVRTTDS